MRDTRESASATYPGLHTAVPESPCLPTIIGLDVAPIARVGRAPTRNGVQPPKVVRSSSIRPRLSVNRSTRIST